MENKATVAVGGTMIAIVAIIAYIKLHEYPIPATVPQQKQPTTFEPPTVMSQEPLVIPQPHVNPASQVLQLEAAQNIIQVSPQAPAVTQAPIISATAAPLAMLSAGVIQYKQQVTTITRLSSTPRAI